MMNARKPDADARGRALRRAGHLQHVLPAALAAASLLLAPPAAQRTIAREAQEPSHAHVYLMRGLMNIFSLGMDQLASAIHQHGIETAVYNHAQADGVVDEIAQRYRGGDHGPIILIGHSLGADAVMQMAQSLDRRGVPIALVIPFDGTASFAAPKNVACVLNLTQRSYAYVHAGAGFHGKISNVNVSGRAGIDHFTIDKSPQLQARALRSVLQTASGESCRLGDINEREANPTPHPAAASPAAHTRPPLRLDNEAHARDDPEKAHPGLDPRVDTVSGKDHAPLTN
jgi:hypothetical protein